MLKFSAIRTELGQISYSCKQRASVSAVADQIKASRGFITVTRMPTFASTRGSVWGIALVKNELDVLPYVVEHLLAQGVDYLLIADNLSDDGTFEYLVDLANRDSRIIVLRDSTVAYLQSEKMTHLAFLAWSRGARWVVPFDADEFWYAQDGTLKDFFLHCPDFVVYAHLHHTVPTQDSPFDLINTELMMDSANSFPGKIAFRAHPLAVVVRGNHDVARLGSRSTGLDIVHLIYRGKDQIRRKFAQGFEGAEQTGRDTSIITPHWAAGAGLTYQDIADVWKKIVAGKPEPRIHFKAEGPMRTGRFLRAKTWQGVVDMMQGDR